MRRDDGPVVDHRSPVAGGAAPSCATLRIAPLAEPCLVRVWTAASVSIFGSLITRIALPLVAILTLGPDRSRSPSCGHRPRGGPVRRPAAGAWVDRSVVARCSSGRTRSCSRSSARSRPPVSGRLNCGSSSHAGPAPVLTTLFDAPTTPTPTIVERERLVEANSALAATGPRRVRWPASLASCPGTDRPDHDPHRRHLCDLGGPVAVGASARALATAARRHVNRY
jgi:hypothetical protein